MVAAYAVGMLIEAARQNVPFDRSWIGKSLLLMLGLVFLRFLFDYLRARCQESISISDSAHVLSVIEDAMDQLDALKQENYIDRDGKEIALDQA